MLNTLENILIDKVIIVLMSFRVLSFFFLVVGCSSGANVKRLTCQFVYRLR